MPSSSRAYPDKGVHGVVDIVLFVHVAGDAVDDAVEHHIGHQAAQKYLRDARHIRVGPDQAPLLLKGEKPDQFLAGGAVTVLIVVSE